MPFYAFPLEFYAFLFYEVKIIIIFDKTFLLDKKGAHIITTKLTGGYGAQRNNRPALLAIICYLNT